MSVKIPKIAHFVYGLWDSGPLPKNFQHTMNMWEKQGWNVVLWNLIECLQLLKKYPQYQEIYDKFPRNVQKADFIRYLIVYDKGGFYFDLDCIPINHLIPLISDRESVYFVETLTPITWPEETVRLFPIRKGIPEFRERIANYAFGAVSEHFSILLILQKVIQRISENPNIVGDSSYYVLYTTGPSALTRVIQIIRPAWPVQKLCVLSILQSNNVIKHLETGTWRNNQDASVGVKTRE